MTPIRLGIGIVLAATSCSDGDGGAPDAAIPSNPGFARPTETTTANNNIGGVWTELGPADWSCLGTPSDDRPTAVGIEVSGLTLDAQTGDQVDNTHITAFRSGDPSLTPVAETISDGDALYSITIPPGEQRLSFLSHDPEGTRFFDTYLLHQLLNPNAPAQMRDVESVSMLSIGCFGLPGSLTCPYLPPVAAAEIRDCNDHPVAHAIATISDLSGEPQHLEGVTTNYFSAGSTSLPVRLSQRSDTNKDGLFIVTALPLDPEAYFQVWGFVPGQDPATDSLTLLAEIPISIIDEAVIWTLLEPRRSP